MSTAAPSGEISEGKSLSYDQVVKQFGALESKLDGLMSIIKEVNVKLEQQDAQRKRAALLAQKVALRRASTRKSEEEEEDEAKRKHEEEEAKRKKLEELKSRLSEVKSKVEETRKMREASAPAPAVTGKGNVGSVAEEKSPNVPGASEEFPAYWKEIVGASDKFKGLGLLSG